VSRRWRGISTTKTATSTTKRVGARERHEPHVEDVPPAGDDVFYRSTDEREVGRGDRYCRQRSKAPRPLSTSSARAPRVPSDGAG